MKILVTGTAGFIGYHTALELLKRGDEVVGIDNINNYYDTKLKFARLESSGIAALELESGKAVKSSIHENYRFIKMDLMDREVIMKLLQTEKFDRVCHLAAQAGVRYSVENPESYIDSNLVGFFNVLHACQKVGVEHLVYASSSSIYGQSPKVPFQTSDQADSPLSLYAATKKANELIAYSYSHLYDLPTTGLRFFTVYGPWGRPDMAYFIFAEKISAGMPIDVYNHGNMKRDFTYIGDIVDGVIKVIDKPPTSTSVDVTNPERKPPFKVYNIGNAQPVDLMEFIRTLEDKLGKKAIINLQPIQMGDVTRTWADVSDLIEDFNYQPNTDLATGIAHFVDWYVNEYTTNISGSIAI